MADNEVVEEFFAHFGVLGMKWGKHKDYAPQQIKRDRQLYGRGGVARINNNLNKGDTISVARGSEVTRRNATLNRNKIVRPIGKGVGGVIGGAVGVVGLKAVTNLAKSRSAAVFIAKIVGANSRGQAVFDVVRGAAAGLSTPQALLAMGIGSAYVGSLLGGDAAVNANTRLGGYQPNRK